MKINISRQSIYLLFLSTFLLIFVLFFSFLVLIPEGKEYRERRGELNKQRAQLRSYEEFSDSTLQKLKQLQSDNRHIITAFDNSFNPKRFEKLHRPFFTSLIMYFSFSADVRCSSLSRDMRLTDIPLSFSFFPMVFFISYFYVFFFRNVLPWYYIVSLSYILLERLLAQRDVVEMRILVWLGLHLPCLFCLQR